MNELASCGPSLSLAEPVKLSLADRVRVVAEIAASQAEDIDRDAAFPDAAIEAARQHGLLSIIVPPEFGGEGASISDVAEICYTLGQACASTAMIFAMHQVALACIVRHHGGSAWHVALLKQMVRENLLLASSTTEGAGGGNVRSSSAPLTCAGEKIALDRAATVVSYGAQADGIVTIARRDGDAGASDQILAVFLKRDYALVPTTRWHTLGMRGTCSLGFSLRAEASACQVLPTAYEAIHAQTMVPVSHLAWGAVWAGIAAGAVARAQAFIRTATRRAAGVAPPGATSCTKAVALLSSLRGILRAALLNYHSIKDDAPQLASLGVQSALNLLKVEISEQAVATVSAAMRACGLSGYRTDGDFTIGRHLRDVLSAPIMIHNERILTNIASTTLMSPLPSTLLG